MRVTEESDDNIKSVMLWLRATTSVIIIAKELGSLTEKKHIHCLFEHDEKKLSTFRQQFLKKFDCYKGNKSYSIEQIKKELDNNVRYLCKGEKKGDHNVLWSKYTDKEIIEFHNKYWEQNESQNYSKKDKKISTETWSQKVLKEFKNDYPGICLKIWSYHCEYKPNDYERECYDECRLELFEFLMSRLGKSAKILDDTIIHKLYTGIMNSIIQEDVNASKMFNKKYFQKLDSQKGLI